MPAPIIILPPGFNSATPWQRNFMRIQGPAGCKVAPSREQNVDAAKIASIAQGYKESPKWMNLGTYACNRFVADVLREAGAPPPRIGGNYPWRDEWWLSRVLWSNDPTAGQWGDASLEIRGWSIVEGGAANAAAGDVVGEKVLAYEHPTDGGLPASGHCGIVVMDEVTKKLMTASADDTKKERITFSDYGFRPDDSDKPGKASKCVFRRRIPYCYYYMDGNMA